MSKTIQQILEENQFPKLTPREVLESYKHIDLTEEEEAEALIAAKQKKEEKLRLATVREKESENRRLFVETKWTYEQTRGFMLYRAAQLFEGKFKVDKQNEKLFLLLCLYFSNSDDFISLALSMGIENPKLDKGVMLAGNFGSGKTWMMQLFSKNQRQCFRVHSAKVIANQFEQEGEGPFDQYLVPFRNPINDNANFLQRQSGLCIDDMGTEDVKIHYGNRKNVIGDLIEQRYQNKHMG